MNGQDATPSIKQAMADDVIAMVREHLKTLMRGWPGVRWRVAVMSSWAVYLETTDGARVCVGQARPEYDADALGRPSVRGTYESRPDREIQAALREHYGGTPTIEQVAEAETCRLQRRERYLIRQQRATEARGA
jgi:hypothetical protein